MFKNILAPTDGSAQEDRAAPSRRRQEGGRRCRRILHVLLRDQRFPGRPDRQGSEEIQMRRDLHGLAWPHRAVAAAARQRSNQGAHAQQDAGSDLPLGVCRTWPRQTPGNLYDEYVTAGPRAEVQAYTYAGANHERTTVCSSTASPTSSAISACPMFSSLQTHRWRSPRPPTPAWRLASTR